MATVEAELAQRFYSAFAARDWQAMLACYHPEVVFDDPAFGRLEGKRAGAMWRMLVEGASQLEVRHRLVSAADGRALVHWEARYPFSGSGRPVHNRIVAQLEYRDGLIVRHHDDFDLWAWSRMALGLPGVLLGWTPWMRQRIRAMALQKLERFIAKHPESG
ncbi:nuclear transport factor 2 family protein [Chitinimonas lacunae]|uniref:Nuclear transport factor 2 family protein n=1 Tax=Chitinimonas lacunae TaxID=1963018 RepID=A0ABV8MRZ2_9NEIS